jgi:putative endonuclease
MHTAIFRFAKNGEISPKAFGFWRIRHTGVDMHYIYILLNQAKTRTYTGVADDIDKRLALHNAGRVKASRPYRPYNVIHTEEFETLKEARQKEKFYKSTTGRRRIKEMFFSPQLH